MVYDKKDEFFRMAEIFNKKFQYEELIADNIFSLPKKNRITLNYSIASWTVKNLMNFNNTNPLSPTLMQVCKDYIELVDLEPETIKSYL